MHKRKLLSAGIISMGWYLLVAFVVPLINNYMNGYAPGFMEHSMFIVVVPAFLICFVCTAGYCFSYILKKFKLY